jgi:hypothetical protein
MYANKCFVLMPFAPAFNNVYRLLKSLVEGYAHCECIRADEIARSNRITDDVYDQIQMARFLIADITGQNPNVYYELGVSHALDKEVIVLVQAGSMVSFDIRGIRYLEYSNDDLDELSKKLREYIRSSLQTVPEHWRTESTGDGPDIRISRVNWPRHATLNQPIQITVVAQNFGQIADTGYFSLSFPSGTTGVKILKSSLSNSRVGEIGQSWKSTQVILDYPIAEAFMWKSQEGWKPKAAHSLTVEVVPVRHGLLQFYVSSSTFLADGQHRPDPPRGPLLDQREEPVYCGVIEVT